MGTRPFEIVYKEVEDIRSRLLLKRWDATRLDVDQRLSSLGKLIGAEPCDELHRHVVVSIIASLETFHRSTIISIVDLGDEYRIRAAESITDKFSMKDALNWLTGKTVTYAELVAHSASCSSVNDLLKLDKLLGCDMQQALADAIDPYDLRNGKESPNLIVTDVNLLKSNLAKAFRLRHIFAHEAATSVQINADECRELHTAVTQWVKAVNAVLWATAYKHLPLTQCEMNQHTYSEVIEVRKMLAMAMRKALSDARAAGSATWLRKNHFAWMNATKEWMCGTYNSLDGTMWTVFAQEDLAQTIRTRAEQVIGWNNTTQVLNN